LATCLFTTAYGFAGWVSGIILLGIGWRRSLSTVRAPIRHTVGWLAGLPFSVRELRIHVGASTKLESIRERLSNSVFMLRSFIDDHNTLEEYVWAAPVGSSTGTVNETLERTLSVVASKKGLVLLKLGRSADAEASYAIETTDQDWQTTVAEIDQKCRTIVMVPGSTPGVVWEIERLIESGNFFNKTLLVFPRESAEAAEMRWNSLRNILAKHQITMPNIPKKRNWDLILVRFMNYGGVEWSIARHNRWANRMSRRAYLWTFSAALDKFVA
jgi:hypothetical protein